MLSKKRKIELLEAVLEANWVIVHSLEKKLRIMNDPKYVRNHRSMKIALSMVNSEFQNEIDDWVKIRSKLTNEELDFIMSSLPHN